MRYHRFYLPPPVELKHDFWLHDARLVHQWFRVLRFRPGQEVLLFDGIRTERLYQITDLNEREAHLLLRTDYVRKLPQKEIYLLWSLLKKDKNDWVLQKATEIGVSHFWPILADRSEKTGFDTERAKKILIEAAEQCGRSDIPFIREPLHCQNALMELHDVQIFLCEQGGQQPDNNGLGSVALLVGPEGGWSEQERALFAEKHIVQIGLGDFTLRAETASIVAAAKIIGG